MRFKALSDIWRAQYIVSASRSFFPSLFSFLPCESIQNEKKKTHHKRCRLGGGYFTMTRADNYRRCSGCAPVWTGNLYFHCIFLPCFHLYTIWMSQGSTQSNAHWVLNVKYTLKDICEALALLLCVFLCFHGSNNIYLHHSVSRGTANSLTGHTLLPSDSY